MHSIETIIRLNNKPKEKKVVMTVQNKKGGVGLTAKEMIKEAKRKLYYFAGNKKITRTEVLSRDMRSKTGHVFMKFIEC